MLAQAEPGADVADGIVATLSGPDGPALTVRTATAADGEGLDPLFQGLSDEDRHHRFAPGWRGWRPGRYLLDAIFAAAAPRGVLHLHQSRGDILRKWQ